MTEFSPEIEASVPAEQSAHFQVIELKQRLNGDPLLKEEVCAQLAVELVLGNGEFDGQAYESPDAEREAVETLALAVGRSAASWAVALENALAAPGAEWPAEMPSADFADLIKNVESRLDRLNGNSGNING